MTYIGCFISLVLMFAGNAPMKFLLGWHFEIGYGWGGVDFGFPFICSTDCDEELKCHEAGHSIQNAIFGPFAILISFIPSFIRCEYRELKYKITKKRNKVDYDAIWFEGSATAAGLLIRDTLNKERQNEKRS